MFTLVRNIVYVRGTVDLALFVLSNNYKRDARDYFYDGRVYAFLYWSYYWYDRKQQRAGIQFLRVYHYYDYDWRFSIVIFFIGSNQNDDTL